MRKTLITIMLAVGVHAWGYAQGTACLEYWIDQNPVQKVSAAGPDITVDADVSNISRGLHALTIRYQNADGKWSVPHSQYFISIGTHDGIRRMEYWFDKDHAHTVKQVVGSNVVELDIDVSHLKQGVHMFNYRCLDALGHYSTPQSELFIYLGQKPGHAGGYRIEYWFDLDVSQKQQVTSTTSVFSVDADVTALGEGLHSLTYRIENEGGLWSIPHTAFFFKPRGGFTAENLVTAYQYWFDHDFNHAVLTEFDEPASPMLLDILVPTEDLDNEVTPDNIMVVKDEYGFDAIGRKTNLQVRFRDTNGYWSDIQGQVFANILEEPNLTPFIKNPMADEQTSHWTIGGNVTTPSNGHYSGEQQPYFHLTGGETNMMQTIQGLPAMTYRLSFMARTNGTTLTVKAGDKESVLNNEAWERHNVDFTTNGEAFEISISANLTGSAWVDIDDLYLTLATDETPMNDSDWAVLRQFYNDMKGQTWTRKWVFGSNAANTGKLAGVKTREGRVTRISLSENNISGSLTTGIFSLPGLLELNLSGNGLGGDMAALMGKLRSEGITNSHLRYLDLSDNLFTGNAGAVGDIFPELLSLRLAGCHLSELTPVLPQHIETLDVGRQIIDDVRDYDMLIAGETLTETLPTIMLYQHATRDYKDNVTLSLCDDAANPEWKAFMQMHDGGFNIRKQDAQTSVFRKPNGTILQAKVGNHIMPVRMGFANGDVDFNGKVNVVDLQHVINLSLERHVEFYNHTAANIIADDVVNVQDVVSLVLAMTSWQPRMVKAPIYITGDEDGYTEGDNAQAHVYIEDGQLIVDSDVPVAAFDIILTGGESEVRWMLDEMGMQCNLTRQGNKTRIIGYSIMGRELPAGRSVVALTSHTKVDSAQLVDSEATDIDTSLDTATQIAYSRHNFMVAPHGQTLRIWTDTPRKNVEWSVLSLSGQLVAGGELDNLHPGHTSICELPHQPFIVKVKTSDTSFIQKIIMK